MSPKVNLSSHTQARAYQAGHAAALKMLIDTLIETGDVNHLLDVLEDNAAPEDADRFRAYYAAKNGK